MRKLKQLCQLVLAIKGAVGRNKENVSIVTGGKVEVKGMDAGRG